MQDPGPGQTFLRTPVFEISKNNELVFLKMISSLFIILRGGMHFIGIIIK